MVNLGTRCGRRYQALGRRCPRAGPPVREDSLARTWTAPILPGRPGRVVEEPQSQPSATVSEPHPTSWTGPDRNLQRHPQVGRAAHLGADQLAQGVELTRRHLEDQLVVHLEQHPRPQPRVPQGLVHPSIATLMMSAAEPWIGALSAIRSAISRRCRLSEVRSGR